MNQKKIRIEACTNSVASSIAAQEGGAYRIELCDNLYEGGTTPSVATIELCRKYLHIKINVMIRPRGSDFVYSDIEFETMQRDILYAKTLGTNGVVFGILCPNGTIDIERTAQLIQLARPMTVTFHRAFDMVKDPYTALNQLIDLGVDCILTSGWKNKAMEGIENLKELVSRANNRISIMVGSGVTADNITQLIQTTQATEYHLSGSNWVESKMQYRNEGIFMGGLKEIPEFRYKLTDAQRIRQVVEICEAINGDNT